MSVSVRGVKHTGLWGALMVMCACLVMVAITSARAGGVAVPAAAFDPAPSAGATEKAVLAGGCFWGVQAVFQHVNGVSAVVAGYTGGRLKNPTYDDVTTETTGHAESVLVSYDPAVVSYGTLLRVFFSVAHDPTELNRQGPDVGPSYRSNIFYTSAAQKSVADAYIAQLDKAGVFPRRIVTRVDPATTFYPAEDYHQDFLLRNPTYPYIVINDLPKVASFKSLLPSLYRERPVTVFPESAAR
jgi:peptide-methionine (S)-S-oxide reductase